MKMIARVAVKTISKHLEPTTGYNVADADVGFIVIVPNMTNFVIYVGNYKTKYCKAIFFIFVFCLLTYSVIFVWSVLPVLGGRSNPDIWVRPTTCTVCVIK